MLLYAPCQVKTLHHIDKAGYSVHYSFHIREKAFPTKICSAVWVNPVDLAGCVALLTSPPKCPLASRAVFEFLLEILLFTSPQNLISEGCHDCMLDNHDGSWTPCEGSSLYALVYDSLPI